MKTPFGAVIFATVATFASSLAVAIPVTSGSANLDWTNLEEIFEIDASGYENLALEFSALGGGSINPCSDYRNADCIAVGIGDSTLADNLTVTRSWQDFGLYELPVSDAVFDLRFTSIITGGDESMTVLWEVVGDAMPRVLEASEPLTVSLFGLGLAALGFARRRRHG